MRRKLIALAGLLAPLAAGMSQERRIEYAVKIVCGTPDRAALASGAYYTAINIHNPGSETVQFRQKLALTREGQQPGPISDFWDGALKPDQALEIDCNDMIRRAPLRTRFLKGFAVIQSPSDLDIVAVYTAAASPRGTVVDLEIERVLGRRGSSGGACDLPDLVVDSILRPTFVSPGTRIEAVIRNLGPGFAAASDARLIDPSTFQSGTTPYSSTAATPALAAGASATVVFTLPYWVFNPDASMEVTADYKGAVRECREDNNMKAYQAIG